MWIRKSEFKRQILILNAEIAAAQHRAWKAESSLKRLIQYLGLEEINTPSKTEIRKQEH